MPLMVVADHWSDEGYADPGTDNHGAWTAISGLSGDNCFGDSGTISDGIPGGFRIDRQNSSGTHQNIQMQKNDVPKGTKSTVAGVLVEKALKAKVGDPKKMGPAGIQATQRQMELTKALRKAMNDSFASWTYVAIKNQATYGRFRFFKITGDFTIK